MNKSLTPFKVGGESKHIIVANVISPAMFPSRIIQVEEVSIGYLREIAKKYWTNCTWYSIIGHESTAKIASEILGMKVPVNRITFKWEDMPKDTVMIVITPAFRVPEGKVYTYEELFELWKQDKIKTFLVTVAPTTTNIKMIASRDDYATYVAGELRADSITISNGEIHVYL